MSHATSSFKSASTAAGGGRVTWLDLFSNALTRLSLVWTSPSFLLLSETTFAQNNNCWIAEPLLELNDGFNAKLNYYQDCITRYRRANNLPLTQTAPAQSHPPVQTPAPTASAPTHALSESSLISFDDEVPLSRGTPQPPASKATTSAPPTAPLNMQAEASAGHVDSGHENDGKSVFFSFSFFPHRINCLTCAPCSQSSRSSSTSA